MAVYSQGKRAKKRQEQKRNKKIIIGILICIIILAIIYLVVSNSSIGIDPGNNEQVAKPVENNEVQTSNNEQAGQNAVEEKKDEIVSDVTIPEKVGKYKVDGRLVISKIGVKCDIVHGYADDALTAKSVGHIAGPELNEPGNFCIVGHRDYQFKKLKTLKKRRYIIHD